MTTELNAYLAKTSITSHGIGFGWLQLIQTTKIQTHPKKFLPGYCADSEREMLALTWAHMTQLLMYKSTPHAPRQFKTKSSYPISSSTIRTIFTSYLKSSAVAVVPVLKDQKRG